MITCTYSLVLVIFRSSVYLTRVKLVLIMVGSCFCTPIQSQSHVYT